MVGNLIELLWLEANISFETDTANSYVGTNSPPLITRPPGQSEFPPIENPLLITNTTNSYVGANSAPLIALSLGGGVNRGESLYPNPSSHSNTSSYNA